MGWTMTKHDIYDEIEGFQVWNYMECDKDGKRSINPTFKALS
jgi:hypothetical protein